MREEEQPKSVKLRRPAAHEWEGSFRNGLEGWVG